MDIFVHICMYTAYGIHFAPRLAAHESVYNHVAINSNYYIDIDAQMMWV